MEHQMLEPTTNDDKSTTAGVIGMKRKIDEQVSESEDDMYIESDESEDEDYCKEEEEEEDHILIDGRYYSNDDLVSRMWSKERFGDDISTNNKFFNKVRRYLKSIHESDGFDISDSDWPGHIWGITTVAPRSKLVIQKRHRYPEAYKYIMLLATKAIMVYNKEHDTNYKVEGIEQVNSRATQGYSYYITFTAYDMDVNHKLPFQARVWDNVPGRWIEVKSCYLKSA